MPNICKNCGAELRQDDKFCVKCGTPVTESEIITPVTTPKKKGASKAVTITLIAAAVIVVLIIGLIVVAIGLPFLVGGGVAACGCGVRAIPEFIENAVDYVELLTHEHTYDYYSVDSEDHFAYCTYDGCSESFTEEHAYDLGRVTKNATHTSTGTKKYTCSICDKTRTETIEKTPEHEFGTLRSINSSEHASYCACGETKKEAHSFGAYVSTGSAQHESSCACGAAKIQNHSFDAGVVTMEATHTSTGMKKYTCSVCKGTKTETLAKVGDHSFGAYVSGGSYEHVSSCACGETKREAHSFGATTSVNDYSHTKKCSVCAYNHTESHTFGIGTITKPATHSATGTRLYTCSDCGTTKTETIPKSTAHLFDTFYPMGSAYEHRAICSCGAEAVKPHTFDAGKVTKIATEAQTGIMAFTCTQCRYVREETIPRLAHTHYYSAWTANGSSYHIRTCPCGDKLSAPHAFDANNRCMVCGYKK